MDCDLLMVYFLIVDVRCLDFEGITFLKGRKMIREIVMAGISVGAVIALAWWMDHPKKEVGSLLAVGVFVVIVVVAFVKNKNQVTRYQRMKHKRDE